MAQLKTKVLLRSDSTANWLENSAKVLSKGEIGIEFLTDGSTKFKIGDGIKTWAELDYFGGEISVDGKSIVINGETISLVGFAEAESGAQPRKAANGSIEWVKPDTTTVEGLQTAIEGLENDVENLQTSVNDLETTTDTLASDIQTLEENVYTKEEVNGLVSGVYHYKGTVTTYSELPTEGQVIGDVYNIEQGSLVNNINAGDNVAWNGTGWDVLAGVVDLSAYALKTDVVAKEEGKRLITDAEGEKLANIEDNAEANLIEVIKLNDVALEITEKSVNIPIASDSLGIVKSSNEENGIAVDGAGAMSVNSLNVNKLVQSEGEELVFYCGSASD